jgi:hypothetical protein
VSAPTTTPLASLIELIAELPARGALLSRTLELDETWGDGALHEFAVSYEAARPGGTVAAARKQFDRAVELAHGRHLGVFVSWAEGPLVDAQKCDEFEQVLRRVLEADPAASPDDPLANTIAQRRAKLLLAHADDLFD